jgi:biopolymer transport protein ExbD
MAERFDFGPGRRARRPSLTPLIDVVFLLMVFFMLAARFGAERAMPLMPAAGGGGAWEGPPRLVEVAAGGLRLNGQALALDGLAEALAPLMPAPDSPVVLRPDEGAPVQALVEAMAVLRAAGMTRLVVLD